MEFHFTIYFEEVHMFEMVKATCISVTSPVGNYIGNEF